MSKQSKLEMIRSMESELLRAVSQTFGELEVEMGDSLKPIASNCETNAAKALLGKFNVHYSCVTSSYTAIVPFLREAIQLLVAVNKRIDRLEPELSQRLDRVEENQSGKP